MRQLDRMASLLQGPMPGFEVQMSMSPVSVQLTKKYYQPGIDARKAAVLLLLYPVDDTWHTVLIKRTNRSGDIHSGQISLPGGSLDSTDSSLKSCALRETNEELGIPTDEIKIIGELSNLYVFASNFMVSPFVGIMDHTPVWNPSKEEVQNIFTTPMSYFDNQNIIRQKDLQVRNTLIPQVPYYDLDGEVMWGATAMIMAEFIDLWRQSDR